MLKKLVQMYTKCQRVMIDETLTTRRNGQLAAQRTKAKSVNINLLNNSFNNQIMKYQVQLETIVLVHNSNNRSRQQMETPNNNPGQTKLKVINKTQLKKVVLALVQSPILIIKIHK
jgi:hypothetical protein